METLSIPNSVAPLKQVFTVMSRHPALTPLSEGVMIEMPCCGLRFDAEAIDCSQDGPSRVYWPPRWTCLSCDRTFTPSMEGHDLVEVEPPTTERRCEETAGHEMTRAVAALRIVHHYIGGTTKQPWLAEIERLAVEAKCVRDAMYAEQGAMQYVA